MRTINPLSSSKLIVRSCLAALAILSSVAPRTARADAVLTPDGFGDPSLLDIEAAIAVTPNGSTRWSRIHFGGARQVLWLVPVRPGAAIDWAPDAWLDALDNATAVQVIPPTEAPPCGFGNSVERVPSYPGYGTTRKASSITVNLTEADARNRITTLGYKVSPTMSARIASVYGGGSELVAVEIVGTATGTNVSPTLRVSDSGGAVLPFALTSSDRADTHISAIVIGSTPVDIDGSQELRGQDLLWGASSSDFGRQRAAVLAATGGPSWLRESSSQDFLFDGAVAERRTVVAPVVSSYFQTDPSCATTATNAGKSAGTVGRVCAPGAVAVVPGGATCSPSTGSIDAALLSCTNAIDLALAVSGGSPSSTYVTRFSGFITSGGFGSDVALVGPAAAKPSIITAGAYEECNPPASAPPVYNPPASSSDEGDDSHVTFVTVADGCSGSTTAVETADTTEGEEQTSSSGCGGSSASSSSDDTNQSSSDSCSGSSTSSSDDGWDKADDSSCRVGPERPKKGHAGRNALSRIALGLALVILPLRRRLRRA